MEQAENPELHATLREQAQLHLEETKRHAAAVQNCLEALGTDTSAIKTGIAQVAEAAKGVATALRPGSPGERLACRLRARTF